MISASVSIYFGSPWLGHTIKINYKITHSWSRDMYNFYLLGKSVVVMSPPRFVYYFSIIKYLSCYKQLAD